LIDQLAQRAIDRHARDAELRDQRVLANPGEQSTERVRITIQPGTLGSALQILRIMGIRTVHLVGFDGGGQHAAGFAWRTRLRADHARDYDQIKHAAILSAQIMGLTLKFFNQPTTDDFKMKTVKFTRNAFAECEPYAAGQVATFSEKIANELLVAGAAVYVKLPTTPAPVASEPSIDPAPPEPVKTKRKK
jgi:pimeloyl-ACP methyl ester carboxylesterase